MNVLLRSHDDAELSLTSPSCGSATGQMERIHYRPEERRRHSSSVEKEDKSRARSCSPVRRLLAVTTQWGSMKSGSTHSHQSSSSSSSETRRRSFGSFTGILFSGSSAGDDVEEPTEIDSLDFSGDSLRSLNQGISTLQLELEQATLEHHSQHSGEEKGERTEEEAKSLPQNKKPNKNEGSASSDGTATTTVSSTATTAVPFPPEPTKSSRKRRPRTASRTKQEWEDLVAMHQKMNGGKANPQSQQPQALTAAALHRRVLERKGLNARKLKLKQKCLEAPEETQVQSKLQPRRKSMPTASKTLQKRKTVRRSVTSDDLNSSCHVPPLATMKKHLQRRPSVAKTAAVAAVPEEAPKSPAKGEAVTSKPPVSPSNIKPVAEPKDASKEAPVSQSQVPEAAAKTEENPKSVAAKKGETSKVESKKSHDDKPKEQQLPDSTSTLSNETKKPFDWEAKAKRSTKAKRSHEKCMDGSKHSVESATSTTREFIHKPSKRSAASRRRSLPRDALDGRFEALRQSIHKQDDSALRRVMSK